MKSAYRSIFRFASVVTVLAVLTISPSPQSGYARNPEKSTTSPLASPFDMGWYDGYYVNSTNDYVRAVAVDGKNIYVAGNFSVAGNVVANQIAMWDGTAWNPLGSGLNGAVSDMAVDGRGHLYVVGRFTQAGGKTANSIARWDGQEWDALGAGIVGEVNAIALDACGNVYAGGAFQYAGETQNLAVARWDGSNWHSLGEGLSSLDDPAIVFVNALSVDRFGYLYVGGVFTHAGGNLANNVARWDGTEWTPLGSGIEGKPPLTEVWSMAADDRGKLYVGGEFSSAGGITVHNLAVWDGEKWSEVGGGLESDQTNTWVKSLLVDGGNLYVGGQFDFAGGTPVGQIAKWDGANWENLNGGVYWEEWIASVHSMALDRDGNLVVGGRFSLAGGKNANQVALWDGNDWNALGSDQSVNGEVTAMVPDRQGGFYVAGSFIAAGGQVVNHVAHWDGDSWSGLSGGVSGGQYGPKALALALDSHGNLYIGGEFTNAGYTHVSNIAKWVGDHWEALGSGIDGTVNALAIDSQDNLYVSGLFETAGDLPVNYIAKWTGMEWEALGNGLSDPFASLAVDAEDRLIAGGYFYSGGGPTTYNLTRWDGTAWEFLDIPYHGSVGALLVDGDTLYIGGSLIGKMQDGIFTQIGGDLSIGLDNGYVSGLTMDNKGRLVAGGQFAQVGETPANNIARWDGNRWESLGSGIDDRVNALMADDQGRVLAGGPFSLAGGKVSSYLARWQDPIAVWLPDVFR